MCSQDCVDFYSKEDNIDDRDEMTKKETTLQFIILDTMSHSTSLIFHLQHTSSKKWDPAI